MHLDTNSPIVTGIQTVDGTATTLANGSTSITGAVGVAVAHHDVEVIVGSDSGDTTNLMSANTISISSKISQSTSMSTSASTSKPDANSNNVSSVAISIPFADYFNTATVTWARRPGSTRSGRRASPRPSPIRPIPTRGRGRTTCSGQNNLLANLGSKGLSGLTYYDDGMLGISNIINNSATANASGGKNATGSSATGFSFSLNYYDDTSKVTIDDGAQINQLPQFTILGQTYTPTTNQGVTVSATTSKNFLNAVGNYSFSLGDGLAFKIYNKGWSSLTQLSKLRNLGRVVERQGRGPGPPSQPLRQRYRGSG